MVHGGGWSIGRGQFSADFTATTISFDSGVKLNGKVSGNCTCIDWDNDSSWKVEPPPPPPITDVCVLRARPSPPPPPPQSGAPQTTTSHTRTPTPADSKCGHPCRHLNQQAHHRDEPPCKFGARARKKKKQTRSPHSALTPNPPRTKQDVGYNGIPGLGLMNNIVQRYFDVYFPRAITVAQALAAHGGPERLIYTTHGWLAHLYLHCPQNFTLSGITLVCPAADAVAAFRAAAQRGDITWHAAAFNTEYENAFNEEMISVQFQLSADLADELGLPRPATASLRDVPGTTRALVPILARHNITALSVGVNGGSPAPDMPNPGVWKDPASGASVLYMQTGQGQGYPNNPGPDPANCGGMCRAACVVHPATTHALCWAFRTDNSGPPESAEEVFRQFDIARWQFPGANVFASTFDNFTARLLPVAAALPVTTAEAGDT